MQIRSLSIKFRLILIGVIALLAMTLMLVLQLYQASSTSALSSAKSRVEQLTADMLMLRRHEKDFLMRKEEKYPERHKKVVDELQTVASSLRKNLADLNIDTQQVEQFTQLVGEYSATFARLVELERSIGLGPDDGLRGTLRDAAKQLESRLSTSDVAFTTLLQMRRDEKDFLMRNTLEEVVSFNNWHDQLEQQLPNGLNTLAANYVNSFNLLAKKTEARGLTPQQGAEGKMRESIQATEDILEAMSSSLNQELDSSLAQLQTIGFIIFVIVLLLVAGLIIMLAHSINAPLAQASMQISRISKERDFKLRLEEAGNDEITHFSNDVNALLEEFQDLVKSINVALTNLNSATEQLATATNDTAEGMRVQQNETDMVATAITEMGATIQEITTNTESTADKARTTNDNAMDGRNQVKDTVSSIRSLVNRLDSASGAVSELEKDSQTIGTVLDVIRGIAEQTNLLALNAAIEAARAGEQGRGFAVVADEVRTLAMRTQESTSQIESIISGLQTRTQQIVTEMKACLQEGANSGEQGDKAMQRLNEIGDDVTTILDMTTQIAAAIEQQSQVATEVNRNVVNIRDLSENTMHNVHINEQASEEVATQTSSLRQHISQFKA
ncbi:methyl-accepting chemotaxis protein [Alteromonas gilva]|uniref:Methyl-accepting chemotaxis protein n=1 Tax=Alteromonas gilva TaxID=2987522 RepID=A0ABT5L0H8_9ALTE|nr:methyl-accepting chemotaxis protein [Alteromonas gilva]MDC8830520.1 methyl-accepting chemotaxis protein [Alteromonas gilva]